MLQKKNKLNGFTLIEMVIVAMLLLIVIATLVSVTTVALARNRESKERTVATRLAQEGIEWIRSERDRLGYDAIVNMIPTAAEAKEYCMPRVPTVAEGGFPSFSASACEDTGWVTGYNDLFIRRLLLTNTGSDVEVKVIVSWKKSGDRENYASMSGVLSQWAK